MKTDLSFRVRPAVRRPGGKSRLLPLLMPLIPAHKVYVEPFAGGLAVLLAKPRSTVEVLNDMDQSLVTFYRVVRFHAEPLLAELEWVLNSRQEFVDCREQPGLTDIQKAARWYFRNRTCFGGSNLDTFGVSLTSAADSRGRRMEAVRQLAVRLDRVIIESVDWERCVRIYDRAETFFFMDPPYTECGETSYKAWTTADVMKLRETLRSLKGRWLLTLNDSPDNRRLFGDCEVRSVERAKGIARTPGGAGRYRELIIRPRAGAAG